MQTPEHTPTGFSKRLNVPEQAPAPPPLTPDEKVPRQQQPPLVPADDRAEQLPVPATQHDSLHTPLHCEPGCCTRVGPRQEMNTQPTQSPTPPPAPAVYQPAPAVMYQPLPDVFQPPPAPQASTTPPPGPAL